MNDQDREDLESLDEIYNSSGLGEALKDGAYGYDFNDKEIQEAFNQANLAATIIDKAYNRLIGMED